MFVRCKRNKSGSTSVQIIDKSSGRYIVHQTVGSSSDQQEIDRLVKGLLKVLVGKPVFHFSVPKN